LRKAPSANAGADDHQAQRQRHAERWRDDDARDGFPHARPDHGAEPGLRDTCAEQPADEGVRGRRGNTAQPGDHVPGDGAAKRPEDHGVRDDAGRNDALADRLGYVLAEDREGDEIEEGRPEDGVAGRQDAGRDDGRDGVGRVVQAVEEVERQCDRDQGDQQKAGTRNIHPRGARSGRR
jgi:hypothetical protein